MYRYLYDITVSEITVFACGWFQLEAGTVRSLRVTFDPRPFLGPDYAVCETSYNTVVLGSDGPRISELEAGPHIGRVAELNRFHGGVPLDQAVEVPARE